MSPKTKRGFLIDLLAGFTALLGFAPLAASWATEIGSGCPEPTLGEIDEQIAALKADGKDVDGLVAAIKAKIGEL